MKIKTLIFLLLAGLCRAQQPDLTLFYEAYMHQRYESACSILDLLIDQHPENASLHMYKGKTYIAQRQYGKAVNALREAESMQYKDPHLYQYLGQALREEGLREEAIAAFDRALRSHSHPVPLRLRIAGLHYEQKRFDEAVGMLKIILLENPDHLRARFECGRAYFKLAEYDSAIVHLERGMAVDSTHFSTLLYLGMTHFHADRFAAAQKALDRAIEQTRSSDMALYYLAMSLSKQQDLSQAIALLHEALDLKGAYRMKALRRLVEFYYRAGDTESCLETASQFLAGPPDTYRYLIHYYRGRALSDQSRFAAADSALTLSLALSDLDFIRTVAFFQALNAYEAGNAKEAIGLYRRVIAIDPNFPAAVFNLAVVYDKYYADKSSALKTYEDFLLKADEKAHAPLINTAQERITQIKQVHFFKSTK